MGPEERQGKALANRVPPELPAMICRWQADGTVTYANENYCQWLGMKPEQLVGRNLWKTLPYEERMRMQERVAAAAEQGSYAVTVHRVGGAEGDRLQRWFTRRLFSQGAVTGYEAVGGWDLGKAEGGLSQGSLPQRLATGELVADIALELLSLHPDTFNSDIDALLARLGRGLGVDCVLLLRLSSGCHLEEVREWHAEDLGSCRELFLETRFEALSWWCDCLKRQGELFLEDATELPPEAALERHLLKQAGLTALGSVPLQAPADGLGGILVIASAPRRVWLPEEMGAVRALGRAFGKAIERVAMEQALAKLNRALRTLSACDAVLVGATDEQLLLQRLPRILTDIGGYDLVWIAFPARPEEAAAAEFEVCSEAWAHPTERPERLPGSAEAAEALRTGKAVLVSQTAEWQPEMGRKAGIGSLAALPLAEGGRLFGVLVLCSGTPTSFDPEETALLRQLAENLARALANTRVKAEGERTEQALRASEESLRNVIERNADGVVVLDGQARVLFANPAAERLLGRPREQLLGKEFGFPITTGGQTEVEIMLPEGALVSAEMRVVAAEWGRAPAYVVSMHDVTERKRFEEERNRNLQQRQAALVKTIEAIALAVEKRDPYTAGHQRRVAQLATAIAEELGFDPERKEGVRLASLILGVGKIYIPAEILNRPGRLSDTEFAIVRSYPEVGFEILKGIEFPWPVADMVLQHRELMDGSGYPKGIRDGQIIPEARILAVADVVAAVCSHRPYRPALGVEAALELITKGRGSRYDPEVVDATVELFRERGFSFEKAVRG